MKFEWIEYRLDLPATPQVLRMTVRLGAPKALVVGACMMTWAIAERHAVDGVLAGYDAEAIDALVEVAGFTAAMVAVGWLEPIDEGLRIPEHDRHLGRLRAYREREARRKREWRAQNPDWRLRGQKRGRGADAAHGGAIETETETEDNAAAARGRARERRKQGPKVKADPEIAFSIVLPPKLCPDDDGERRLREAIAAYIRWRTERGGDWTPSPEVVTRLVGKLGREGWRTPEGAVVAIERSIEQGWRGVHFRDDDDDEGRKGRPARVGEM